MAQVIIRPQTADNLKSLIKIAVENPTASKYGWIIILRPSNHYVLGLGSLQPNSFSVPSCQI